MTDDPETADDGATRRDFMKTGAVASGALVLGGSATVAARDNGGPDVATALNVQEDDDDEDQGEESQMFASVEFSNQESDGMEVDVDHVTLSHGGYVAFHDGSLLEGNVVGSVIGVSDFHEAGMHYGETSTLFDVPGANFDQNSLQGTSPLVAMPHRETSGNEEYNFVESDGVDDGPYTEAGLPVIDLGYVAVSDAAAGTETEDGTAVGDETATPDETATETAEEMSAHEETDTETPGEETTGTDAETATDTEAAEPFAAIDFSNQVMEDDEVTVGKVTLSQGGYVALHDARLVQGQVLESVVGSSEYLEAGTHHAVEVSLDEDAELTEVALPAPPIIPMAHRETNDNESYDFVTSDGAEDGPYTKAGQAVVDIGLVTREDAEAEETEEEETETEEAEETETEEADETETEGGMADETETPTETDDY